MEEEEKRFGIAPPGWRLRGTQTVSCTQSTAVPTKFPRFTSMCRSNVTRHLNLNR